MTNFEYLEILINERRIVAQNLFYLQQLRLPENDFLEDEAILRYNHINNKCDQLIKAFEYGSVNPNDIHSFASKKPGEIEH